MTNTTSDSATLPLTERNFSEIVAATPFLLVDFWAPWCGPCRAVAPVLEELARAEAGRVVVAKVNVDEEPTLAQRYGVQAIPTLLFFKDGQIVDTAGRRAAEGRAGPPPRRARLRAQPGLSGAGSLRVCSRSCSGWPRHPRPLGATGPSVDSRLRPGSRSTTTGSSCTPASSADALTGARALAACGRLRPRRILAPGGARMRVLVLGGGIAGVTAAYFLAKDGHEVTLLEEQDGVGRDASAGNAGIIAPGHSFAWASPKAPAMLFRSLLGHETAIRVRPRLDPALIAWGLRFLRECTAARARRNTIVKLRLCQYSQAVMTRPGGRRGHRVPRGEPRRALPLPRSARARGGRPEDGAPGRARAAPGGPGPRAGRAARSRLRAGPRQDRGRRPGPRRLERRLPAVHREPGADLPRASWA